MKRFFVWLLALCLLWGPALADSCYAVLPMEMDEAALRLVTFGDGAVNAQREQREDGQVLFDLPDRDGPPSCSYACSPVQAVFDAFGPGWKSKPEEYDGAENVWPTGLAECALSREEAALQAEGMLKALAPGEYALQSITAYGRVPGYRDEYCVAFLQRLNGRAVYWSASVSPADRDTLTGNAAHDLMVWPESNRVEITLDETGLIRLKGAWCRYEPLEGGLALMEQSRAAEAFRALGFTGDAPELCYFLSWDGQSATALPAWRQGNRFLHGATGERLQ